MHYPEETIYISAIAKLPAGIPSENVYKVIDVGLVIHREQGLIVDASLTLLTRAAEQFLQDLIIGYNLQEQGLEPLIGTIQDRYHGAAQKAVMVALKQIHEKYLQLESQSLR